MPVHEQLAAHLRAVLGYYPLGRRGRGPEHSRLRRHAGSVHRQFRGKLLFVDEDALPIVEPVLGSLRDLRREQVIVAGASDGWCSAEEMIARADKAPVWVDVEPSDSINIVYTSGSTGAPKGIEHSHLARHSYTFGMGHWFGFSRESVTC